MKKETITSEQLRKKFEVIKNSLSPNQLIGSPIWTTRKRILRKYFKDSGISEMSATTLEELTGINKSIGLKMLIEINSEYFKNK